MNGPTLEQIKTEAQRRIFDVLRGLGIDAKPSSGGYISMCNPVEKDSNPSFTIWVKKSVGAWKDHRGIAQGDVIDLVAYVKGWHLGPKKGRREALRWLADRLGLQNLSEGQRQADQARSRAIVAREAKRGAEELAAKRERARRLWLSAAPIGDTPGEIYLKARSIDLAALPEGPRGGKRLPGLLRFLAAHRHTESRLDLPCMIAGCVDHQAGEILAVHRTWLRPDFSAKADVEPNRKCFPDFRGLVIPLWRGDSGLSITAAADVGLRETLVLAEGIETALSAAISAPQFRTWAFISLGNLQNVVLPECVDAVLLHRENEWSNRAAVAAFERGKRALEAQGRPVAEIAALGGKDLNDTLRASG